METLYSSRFHGFANFTAHYTPHFPTESDEGVLSLIIVLTTSVSLVALVFAFITYSLFSDLKNLMGTTVMTLLATAFMSQLIFVIGVGGVHNRNLCVGLSHGLLFLHLSVLCWFLCLCRQTLLSLNETEETAVYGSKRRMLADFGATCLWTWGIPMGLTGLAYRASGGAATKEMFQLNCWFPQRSFYLLFWALPSLSILVTSICLIVRSKLRLLLYASLEPNSRARAKLVKGKSVGISLCSRVSLLLLASDLTALSHSLTQHSLPWTLFLVIHSISGLVFALCTTCHSSVLSVYSHRRKRIVKSPSSTKLLTSPFNELDYSPLPSTV